MAGSEWVRWRGAPIIISDGDCWKFEKNPYKVAERLNTERENHDNKSMRDDRSGSVKELEQRSIKQQTDPYGREKTRARWTKIKKIVYCAQYFGL